MKRSILMVAVLIAAVTALADQPIQPQTKPQSPSQTSTAPQAPVSMTANKHATVKKVEVFTPLSKKLPPSKPTDKVERVDGISSQPWFRTVGPRPGWSAFPEPERQDPTLDVFWIGAPPMH
jgi:hypothetical protein